MDIAQMEYFKAIAETGSMTRAAEELHTSQPALSAMVKRLERELDVTLFDRTPNRAALNGAGEIVLLHINSILQEMDAMRSDLRRYAQRNTSLTIAFCDPGVRWYCVPRFSFAHPNLQVSSLDCGEDALRLLVERTCDAVVVPDELRNSKVVCVPFLVDQVLFSAPSHGEFLGRESMSLREVSAQPLLLPNIGGYFSQQIERIIQDERPDIQLVKNEFPVTQHMIRTTNFLATVSSLSMEMRYDGEERRFIPLTDPELNVTWRIAYLKENRERVRPFLVWAKECAEERRKQE